MFKYMDGKGICIGDIQLSDGRRVLLRELYEEEKKKTNQKEDVCELNEEK